MTYGKVFEEMWRLGRQKDMEESTANLKGLGDVPQEKGLDRKSHNGPYFVRIGRDGNRT